MIGVTVLGSTGSIGVNTLDVIGRHRDKYRVVALTAHSDVDGLFRQCLQYQPAAAVMVAEHAAAQLRKLVQEAGLPTEVLSGEASLADVARAADSQCVMAAIVGAAGLLPTLAAVRAGKRVLLANKEALVMAGHLFMNEVGQYGAELIPIDSEHNALFQCMPARYRSGNWPHGVRRILLTASGGPFRSWPLERLAAATPAQACSHPNWVMGRKISVDSATMMNKGLEVIEACWLFGAEPARVEVVVHPQSVIHSLVEYDDGSVLAQLGNPDMRTPIACGLAWPDRLDAGVEPLDLFALARMDFEAPDLERFPCLRLAMQAAATGGNAPVVLNAANEVAVAAFLEERIGFTAIAEVVDHALEQVRHAPMDTLDSVLACDSETRRIAMDAIARMLAE
ncbi:MAG TPA: 1-deoxy-D-xylulose-5-phosphate reductoisomerase [Gammaproteobacteria bacterium]|nr:1-deoxy-D-xylulose-5-phosphate reductoisomerase [Gammaproteobacteria bacterium]